MRNPFARLAVRDDAKPTFRERLKATKEKYARTLRVHRAMHGPLPDGWPALDAEILTALVDLRRIEYAQEVLTGHLGDRDPEDVPGFNELLDAWDETFDAMRGVRAKGLPGLQAKA